MNMKKMANVILCLFVGIVFFSGLVGLRTALTSKGLFATDMSQEAEGVRRVAGDVRLNGYDIEQDPYRWVKAKFVVSNLSAQGLKNIRVVCESYDAQARYLGSEKWLLAGVVPTGKTMEHNSLKRKFIHTRATDFQCYIARYDSILGSPSGNNGTEEEHRAERKDHAAEKDAEHH